jgi:hypothetical protein
MDNCRKEGSPNANPGATDAWSFEAILQKEAQKEEQMGDCMDDFEPHQLGHAESEASLGRIQTPPSGTSESGDGEIAAPCLTEYGAVWDCKPEDVLRESPMWKCDTESTPQEESATSSPTTKSTTPSDGENPNADDASTTALEETKWSVWDGIDVCIPSWEKTDCNGRTIPFYRIQLTNKYGLKWSVSKRYSEFQRLHQQLGFCRRLASINAHRKAVGSTPPSSLGSPRGLGIASLSEINDIPEPPQLPGTRWLWWTNSSEESIDRRRRGLEQYLRELLEFKTGYYATALLDQFLEIPTVRAAQRLLAGPRHLPNPIPLARQRLPAYSVPDAIGENLVPGLAGSPSITLTPPDGDFFNSF